MSTSRASTISSTRRHTFQWSSSIDNFHQPNGYNGAATYNNSGIGANGTADFHERFLIANAETALTSHSANVVHFQWARDLETDGTNQGGPFNCRSATLPPSVKPPPFPAASSLTSIAGRRPKSTPSMSATTTSRPASTSTSCTSRSPISSAADGSFTYTNANAEYNFTNFIQDAIGVNPTRTYTPPAGAATVANPGTLTASGIARHYNAFAQTVDSITGVGADDFWNQNIDGFVEDSWKIKPNLTLQLGIRYDAQLVPGPDMPNTLNPVAFNATSQINPDLKMIQPRVGFNWNPYPGTVVRGGYGIFYGQISNSSYYTLRRENGIYQRQFGISATGIPTTIGGVAVPGNNASGAPTPYVAAGALVQSAGGPLAACVPVAPATVCYSNGASYVSYAPAGGVPIFTPPGPAPTNPVTGAPITSTGLAAVPGSSILVRGLDPSFQNPQSHSVDLAVEQGHAVCTRPLTISYVGNRALRLPVYVDTNIDPASAVTRTYQYTSPTGQVTTASLPVYTNRLYTSTAGVATGFSDVNSWYHSLVFSVRKPMSHGVEVLANYTWSKAMDGGQTYGGNGTFNGTDAPLIPFALGHRQGRSAEYALSDLNIKGRFVGTIVLKSHLPIANHYVAYAKPMAGCFPAQSRRRLAPQSRRPTAAR